MRVDEARQHRHLREIDDPGVLRLGLYLGERPDRPDAVAVDEDADVGLGLVGAAVDEAARLDEDGLGPGRGRQGRRGLGRERARAEREDRAEQHGTVHGSTSVGASRISL